jgi:hypothetical protein
MRIKFNFTLDVDEDDWELAYGMRSPIAVRRWRQSG